MSTTELRATRRAIVTGDLWRPSVKDPQNWDQRPNVAWLSALIRIFTEDEDICVWVPEIFADSYQQFMKIQGRECSHESWATAYRAPIEGVIKHALEGAEGDILIGFEMPPALMKGASQAGLAVINVRLHPVRCLPDLLLYVETDRSSSEVFAPYVMTDADIRLRVAPLVARVARERTHHKLPVFSSPAVLFAQSSIDRSLIYNNKIVSLSDYVEEIKAILDRFGTLMVRLHPSEGLTPSVARALVAIPGVFVTDRVAYDLLTDPATEIAISMSSSVLSEAQLLGKGVLRLAPDEPLVLNNEAALSLDGFLCGLCDFLHRPRPSINSSDNSLRNIVGLIQGYTSDVLIGLRRRPPQLPHSEISFGNPDLAPSLVHGFSCPEEWGVRMRQSHGVVEFELSQPIKDDAQYVFTVQATGASGDQIFHLSMYCNGAAIYDQFVDRPDFIHAIVPVNRCHKTGVIQIHFILNHVGGEYSSSSFGDGLALWSMAPI